MMDEGVMKRDALICHLPLWLRQMWLPPPEALPVSYPFHALVPPAELWPRRKVNGTVHFRYLGPSNDEFRLRLPLYGLEPERGSTLVDGKEDWHLVLVPLSEVAQSFWRRYGVNLLALSALQAVGGTSLSGKRSST